MGAAVYAIESGEKLDLDRRLTVVQSDRKIGRLLRVYPDILEDYINFFDNFVDVLEIDNKRRAIVETLLSLRKSSQLSLFGSEECNLDDLLGEILDIRREGRSLYARYQKDINGKVRNISVPRRPVERFLREYAMDLVRQAECHERAHGSENGWDPKKSIAVHLPIGTVLSFDLTNAHENTHSSYLFGFYYNLLEGRVKDELTRRDVAMFLTAVSTVHYQDLRHNALPQGSPISSLVFNRILKPIDDVLYQCCLERDLTYTRWGDDFTISARELDCDPRKLLGALDIVERYFPVSPSKVYLQSGKTVYLLGQRARGRGITSASCEELASRRRISLDEYRNGKSPEPWVEFEDTPVYCSENTESEVCNNWWTL